MNKSTQILTGLLIATSTLIFSCKKNTTSSDPADSYVGIWAAKDSAFFNQQFTSLIQYNFSITKKDANTVYFLNFSSSDTLIFSVSPTSFAFVSAPNDPNQSAYFYFFNGSRNDNTLNYSIGEKTSPYAYKKGTATKQ
jgi:hypothetical protein